MPIPNIHLNGYAKCSGACSGMNGSMSYSSTRYAQQLELTEITLALFVDAVDDVNRAKYEAVYADKAPFGNGATGVTVRPVFVETGT